MLKTAYSLSLILAVFGGLSNVLSIASVQQDRDNKQEYVESVLKGKSHDDETLTRKEKSQILAEAMVDREGFERARLANQLARLYFGAEQYEDADRVVSDGLKVALAVDSRADLVRLYQIDAAIAFKLGELERSVASSSQVIKRVAPHKPDSSYCFHAYLERGIAKFRQSRFDSAVSDFRQALELATRTDRDQWRMRAYSNLATAYGTMGLLKQAIEVNEAALDLARKQGQLQIVATIASNLGNDYVREHKYELAEDRFQESFDLATEHRWQRLRGMALIGLGDVAAHNDKLEDAYEKFSDAQDIFEKLQDRSQQLSIQARLSLLDSVEDGKIDTEMVIEQLESSLEDARMTNDPFLVAAWLERLAFEYQTAGQWEQATELLVELRGFEKDVWSTKSRWNLSQIERQQVELDKQKQTSLTLFTVCGLLLVVVIALAALWRLKQLAVSRLREANAKIRQGEQQKILLERKLAEREKEESLSTMSAGIIHDFNNYLSAIISTAELGKLVSLPEKKDQQFESILSTGMSAADLTRHLSDYMGRGSASDSVCELGTVIQDEKTLWEQVAGLDVTIKHVIDETPAWVYIDPIQVKQIVTNLIKNSREAMQGQGAIEIEVIGKSTSPVLTDVPEESGVNQEPRTSCLLIVRDDGQGMSAKESSRATEPFYSSKGIGRGLGLASVKGIVESVEGSIVIQSREGFGTEVIIELPRVEKPSWSQADSTDDSRQETSQSINELENVLLVEDDEKIRVGVLEYLSSLGMEVEAVGDVESAIDIVEAGKNFNCIITDFVLPDYNGRVLAKKTKRLLPKAPVILVSGYAEDDVFESDLFDGFVAKPFRLQQLLDALQSARDKLQPISS